jgi:uncharacterized membrane protein
MTMNDLTTKLAADWAYLVDFGTFFLCVAMVLIYQRRLVRRIRENPTLTIQGMNVQARAAWVERIMREERDLHTLAVQTFRNSTMAATLLASTAVLLIFGILNLLANADKLSHILSGVNSWGSREPGVWLFKLMLLIVDFFISFFSFSLAVRGFHHVGYMINVPTGAHDHGVTVQKVVRVLNRVSQYYSIGMRTYYFSVPLVLWLFGPAWMFVATVVLLVVLNHLDHLPD